MSDLLAAGIGTQPYGGVILESAARTADNVSPVVPARAGSHGLAVIISVTATSATPSVVFTVRGVRPGWQQNTGTQEPSANDRWDILTSAAVTSTGLTVLRIAPGIEPVTNLAAADLVPDRFYVDCNHADADSITYSVEAIITP